MKILGNFVYGTSKESLRVGGSSVFLPSASGQTCVVVCVVTLFCYPGYSPENRLPLGRHFPTGQPHVIWRGVDTGRENAGCRILLTQPVSRDTSCVVKRSYSTTEAARKLGIGRKTLYRKIDAGIVSAPASRVVGGVRLRLWTTADIERVRKQLRKARK